MRISVFLVIISVTQVFAANIVSSQTISLNVRDMTVREVFREIESQSPYSFFFYDNFPDLNKRIDLSEATASIEEVMDHVLTNTGLTYRMLEENLIVIAPAQQGSGIVVTGMVTSVEDGLGIPGATVMIKGSTQGVATDLQGRYRIEVASEEVILEFSYIGMVTREVAVGSQRVINVALEMSYIQLGEVIVSTGYITERSRNVAGSVAHVSNEELNMAAVENVQRALEGKAAGVQITAASGLPGASSVINIRGISSMSADTRPLIIVDGQQIENSSYATYTQSHSLLAALNPDDIETIDILKDAATASIYGAQGANGVIIITTKRGRVSPKTRVSFSSKIGIENLINRVPTLNSQQYIELSLDGIYNRYGNSASQFESFFNRFAQEGWISGEAADYPNVVYNTDLIPNDDWIGAVFRQGLAQEYQLSLSGGNNNTKYYISLNNNNTQASTITNQFNRISMRINVDHEVSKFFSISSSTMLSNMRMRQPESGGLIANPVRSAMMMVPYNRIYNEDGTINDNLEGSMHTNPITLLEQNIFTATTNKITQGVDLNFTILDGLKAKISGHVDYNDNTERSFKDPRNFQGQALGGIVGAITRDILILQNTGTLNYDKLLRNKHRLNLLTGYEYKNYSYFRRITEASGVPSPDFQLLNEAANIVSFGETYTGYKILGFFGRIGYTFDDKYILNLVVRHDGSSRFGEENMFGTFPSASLAYRIIEESFLKDRFSWLSDLKVKASYGLVGNSAIGNFVARPQFVGSGHYDGISGLNPSVPGNLALTWESKYSLNTGIDLGFFKNRATVSFEYFDDETRNLLYYRGVPSNSGYGSIPQNVGSMRNYGYELSTAFLPFAGNFRWRISSNFTWVQNEITSLVDGRQEITNSLRVGYPFESFLVYNFAGVNPADGRPMWYDKEGYITYNPSSDDRVWINGIMPTFYGGIVNAFSYKGFEFSFLVQFQQGARRYFADAVVMGRVGSSVDRNQLLGMYTDRWQTPGDMTWVAQPMRGNTWLGAGSSTRAYSGVSSLHYKKTDFIKLKNLSISYNLPARWLTPMRLEGVTLSFTGYNLLTTTTYDGYDPEFIGSDSGQYPASRSYTFVLNVNF